MGEPQLESGPAATEAGAGWLLWLSLCAAFVFFLVLVSGEVDRRGSGLGLLLSLALLLYERRRVGNSLRWSTNLGTGCAGGFLLAGVVGKGLDALGLMEVWDTRDKLTGPGFVLIWVLMILGMGMVARWSSAVREPGSKVEGN